MSEYAQFLHERDLLDHYMDLGYTISAISETLEGAMVELQNQEDKKEVLRIITPEGRKYFSVLLIQQTRN